MGAEAVNKALFALGFLEMDAAVEKGVEVIRVFPRKTKWTPVDELAFVGEPPLPGMRPADRLEPVHVSVTFTWDIPVAEQLRNSWARYYDNVRCGGPAYGDRGCCFVPGRYIKKGVTITSRGCPRKCPWCVVPSREGPIRELPIEPGWIVQDNNLLACSPAHIMRVFAMLRQQNKAVSFNGGLDAARLNRWHVSNLSALKLKALWFACDTPAALDALRQASELLKGISIEKRRCYVLMGYSQDTPEDADKRANAVYEMGFLPFAQLYRGPQPNPVEWSAEWRAMARKWSRPAVYRAAGKCERRPR